MNQELTEVQQKQVTIGLAPKLTERQELVNSYNEVIKLPMNEENAKQFRDLRLLLVKNRKEIEKWKTLEKAFYLAGGKFIQSIYNKEVAVNQNMEAKLLEGEQYVARMEAKRLELIRSERWNKLHKFIEVEPVGLSLMQDDMFEALLLGSETTYNNRIEAERKADEERLQAERKKALHQQRKEQLLPYWDFLESESKKIEFGNISKDYFLLILDEVQVLKEQHQAKQKAIQEENERLKKEAAEKEALRVAEEEKEAIKRAEQESILKKEREAKSKLEAELKAKQEAEDKAKQDEAKRLEELAKAPIKDQLTIWVDSFEIQSPPLHHEKCLEIIKKFKSYKKWAKTEIEKI